MRIEEEEEDCVLTQATPIPAQVFPQPHEVLAETNKKEKFSSTKSGNRGYLIDSVHLSLLVSSYHKHFNEYSIGRKKASSQLVPSLVWKLVYADFIKEYPNSTWKEDSLKERLRCALAELKTGTSNEENADKAVLQPADFLEQLKVTNGHAKRNTLKRRQSIIDQMSPSLSVGDSTAVKESSTESVERKRTKTDILAETARGISSLAHTYAKGEEHRDSLILLKMESEKKRCSMFGSKDCSMQINDLFRLHDEGFYSPSEFKVEMQKILDST